MTIDQLRNECEHHKGLGVSHITLVAKRFPRSGFPRGVLLCEKADGNQVRLFKIDAILRCIREAHDND